MEKENVGRDENANVGRDGSTKEKMKQVVKDSSLTTKQKVMIGGGMLASAGIGFVTGYTVANKKKDTEGEEQKELE